MSDRFTRALLLTLALSVAAVAAYAGAKPGPAAKATVLTGTIVDTKCHSMNPVNKSPDHQTPTGEVKACAKACASMEIPVGLLTADGKVYVLVAPSRAFADHMGETARITGARVYGGASLRPDKVEVRGADGKWVALDLASMM